MFDALSERLERVAGRLRSRGRISPADLDEALAEIRTALLDADVELGVARHFVEAVRERCSGEVLAKSLTPGQQVIKAVHEQLIDALGGEALRLTYASRPPTVVLLAGLQGSGKTTAAAKLGRWWKQQGRNPLLVGADLQRPAAVDQLRVLGASAQVSVFSQPGDPVTTAVAGVEEARRLGRDVCIIDTAGRLTIDDALMDEVRRISARTEPHYTFLVIDAMTGQDAVATARAFHQTLALDGVILSKLDSDARGGAALSVKEVVGAPIVFASTGEKLGDLDLFHPDRMADRILGMGDMLTLIEQAERTMDQDVVARSADKLFSGRFTLDDFLEQLHQVQKMGSLGGILRLMPGMSKEIRQAADQIDDGQVSRVEAIVRSMTPTERADPAVVDGSRRVRIARGSGTSTQEVNQLLKQFKEMQKMMRGMGPAAQGGAPGGRLGRLAAARGLGGASAEDSLAEMLAGRAPAAPRTEAPRPPAGSKGRGGRNKKKGGRVTPPKGR
ncbi:MAG TPA: signal recognition particle protein [Acidimicrobiales bacterium]|nr:signal recognition particle protein [Acidimicrobiales bacterium]